MSSTYLAGLGLEQLGVNLAVETLHHLYTSHTLRGPASAALEEGLGQAGCQDGQGAATIDLLSSMHHGLLRMVDRQTAKQSGSPAALVAAFTSTHVSNPRLVPLTATSFAIQHFGGSVTYEACQFLETNRDTMADDLVAVFHKSRCTNGFVSHLFSVELRHLASEEQAPRGVTYR